MEDTKSLQKYNKLAKAIQKENPFFLMKSSFLTLQRMPRMRDEENMLRKGPNLNITS